MSLVDKDLKELDISLSYEDIKNTNKKEVSEFLNEKIKNKALEYLLTLKEKHSCTDLCLLTNCFYTALLALAAAGVYRIAAFNGKY